MSRLLPLGIALFAIGFLPHIAFAFFSPGLSANNMWDVVLAGWSMITLIVLVVASLQFSGLWFVTAVQVILMGLVLVQTFSDAVLYIGT